MNEHILSFFFRSFVRCIRMIWITISMNRCKNNLLIISISPPRNICVAFVSCCDLRVSCIFFSLSINWMPMKTTNIRTIFFCRADDERGMLARFGCYANPIRLLLLLFHLFISFSFYFQRKYLLITIFTIVSSLRTANGQQTHQANSFELCVRLWSEDTRQVCAWLKHDRIDVLWLSCC